jgi:hypothetical protein
MFLDSGARLNHLCSPKRATMFAGMPPVLLHLPIRRDPIDRHRTRTVQSLLQSFEQCNRSVLRDLPKPTRHDTSGSGGPSSGRGGSVPTDLHQTSSHVSSFGCLDGGVDQSFTTRDSVEQELIGGETAEETVSHETLCSGFSVLLLEMRQGSVVETVGNTFTSDNLLSDQRYHLSDVDDGTCTTKGSVYRVNCPQRI